MVTKSFVAKVTRIRNKKDMDYYVHRINLPSDIVEELHLDKEDYLLLRAQKTEWYHMLDWTQMKSTWNKLPANIKQQIIDDGLIEPKKFKSPIDGVRGTGNSISLSKNKLERYTPLTSSG